MAAAQAGTALNKRLDKITQSTMGMIGAMGQWDVHNVRLRSSTSQLTDQIVKQEMTFGKMLQMYRSGGLKNAISAIADEQLRLKNSMIVPSPTGGGKAYALTARGLSADVDRTSAKLGVFNDMLRSGSNHMLNWGKNMQWGGRQLTVGLTLPVVAAGAAMGKLAFDVDNSLGHLKAVYGTTATSQQQLNDVSKETMTTAKEMAATWGVTAKDTIDLAASFAAAGKTGQDLQDITKQTTKIMVLGEVDREQAFKTTISVMQAFHLTANQLTDAFNHMNAVENQTVLTMQDMIAGIPRVAPVVAQLGGNIGDMNVLLTSMKAAGITAEQGGIAISRGLTSIIHPSNTAKETLSSLGINIDGIFERHKGESLPILGVFRDLALQMKDLTSTQQQEAIVTMFGKFQDPRITAMLDQLGLRTGAMSDQVQKAIAAMGMSASEAAAVSAREQEQRTNTAAYKIKRTWATLQADLAQAGHPFLVVGGTILKIVSQLVKAFTGLPGPVKFAFAAFAISGAIVGPIVMLIGLFTNLAAQVIRMGVFLAGLSNKWKTMTKEEILAELAGKNSIGVMEAQQSAIETTNVLLQQMAANWIKVAEAEALANNRKLKKGGASAAGIVPIIPPNTAKTAQDTEKALAGAGEEAAAAGTATRNWTGFLGKSLGIVAAIGISVALLRQHFDGIGGKIVDIGTSLLMVLPLVNLLGAGLKKVIGEAAAARAVGGIQGVVGQKGGSVIGKILGLGGGAAAGEEGLAAGAAGLGMGAAIAGGVGLIGVGAFAGYEIWKHHQSDVAKKNAELIKQNAALADSAKGLGDVIGATWKQSSLDLSGYITKEKRATTDQETQWANTWKKRHQVAFDALKAIADDEQKVKEFIQNQVAVMQLHGADRGQIEDAVRTMLAAIKRQDLRVYVGDVTFGNLEEAADNARKQFEDAMNKSLSDFRIHPSTLYKESTDTSRAFIDNILQLKPEDRNRELKKVQTYLSGIRDDAVKAAKDYFKPGANGTQAGWQGSQSLQQFLAKALGLTGDEDWSKLGADMAGGNIDKYIDQLANMPLKKLQEAIDSSDLSGPSEKLIKNLINIKRESVGFGGALLNTTNLLGSFGKGETNAAAAIAFFGNTAMSADAAAEGLGNSTDTMGKKAQEAARKIKILQNAAQDVGSAMTSNIQDSISQFIDFGLQNYDDQTAAAERSLDAQQAKAVKKSNDHYDKLIKGGKKYGDARLHQINEEIKAVNHRANAEQKAEELRQKIFDAEQRRLQLQAEQQQTTIDYNVAIASGNLDEAARVSASGVAADAQATLEEANAAANGNAQAADKARQKRLKELDREKNHRLKVLNDQKAAAEKAINDEYDARKRAYDKDRAYERMVLNQKLQDQAKYAVTNEKQYNDMFNKLNGMLGEYGDAVTKGSDQWNYIVQQGWSRGMHQAANSVLQDKIWEKLGHNISSRISDAALGMSWHDFMRYLITGKAPKEKVQTHSTGSANIRGGTVDLPPGMSIDNYKNMTSHEGGRISATQRFAGLRPDETHRVLQDGEWVINKDSVEKYGHHVMDSINRGILPKMHDGGPVGEAVGAMAAPAVMKIVNAMEFLIGNAAVRANEYWGSRGGDTIFGSSGAGGRGRGGGFSGASVGGAGVRAIWNNLRAVGMSAAQAAGVMGNMQSESGFNPFIIQGGGTSMNPADAGGGGYGLVQWTPGSKLLNYLGGRPPSIATEIQALAAQLSGKGPSPEGYAGQMLRAATSPRAAAEAFLKYYERPLNPDAPWRLDQAENIYKQFAYDAGGWLKPGITAAFNATKKPEAVLTNEQWQAVKRASVDRPGGNEYTIKVEVADTNASPELIARKVMTEIQKRESARGLSRKIGE